MFRNKKYALYIVVLCAAGFAYMFLCAGLEGGQLELARAAAGNSWDEARAALPMTVGALLAVPFSFAALTGYLRRGVRQGMIVWGAAAALGCVGLMNARDVYWLYFAATVLLRCACAGLEMGVAALGAAWSLRFRGRLLGLVTMGAPLFYAVGAPVIADFVGARLGGDWRPLYLAVAVALALLALAVRFLLRDRPEDAGLYPDGGGRAPADAAEEDAPALTIGKILSTKRTWLLLAVCGAYTTSAAGCMGAMEAWFTALGGEEVWTGAAPWLALGAIFAMPMSYIFGWLGDRLGAGGACIVLGAGLLVAPGAMWAMPQGGSVPLEIVWGLGVAVILGGVSTLLPCALAHAFGRRQYLAAGRVILPAALLAAALAPLGAAWCVRAGLGRTVFLALAALAVLGLLGSVLLRLITAPYREK